MAWTRMCFLQTGFSRWCYESKLHEWFGLLPNLELELHDLPVAGESNLTKLIQTGLGETTFQGVTNLEFDSRSIFSLLKQCLTGEWNQWPSIKCMFGKRKGANEPPDKFELIQLWHIVPPRECKEEKQTSLEALCSENASVAAAEPNLAWMNHDVMCLQFV